MTWEIAVIFLLLVAALVSFAMERIPADVTAIGLMAVLLVTGLLGPDDALSVFSNPAPLTVGAMFILSAALERCGAIDILAGILGRLTALPYPAFLLVMLVFVGGVSAFINNTPVVVVFMPVIVSLARKMDVPASKLLIPLSYASILGGTCTLVGTSTNIIVSSIGEKNGEPAFGMFEIASVGLPLLAAGAIYLMLFGRRLLPVRETITSILTEDERREFITEAFVPHGSPLTEAPLKESPLNKHPGIRVVEVVRSGVVCASGAPDFRLHEGDRLVLACRPSGIAETKQMEGIDFVAEAGLGLEQIAAHEGVLVEGVIGPNSALLGSSILDANIRQRYRVMILAVHRKGRNLRNEISNLTLEFGDILLMLGTEDAINGLRGGADILLIDKPAVATGGRRHLMPWVLGTIAAVVGAAALGLARIEIAAFIGCALLLLIGAVRPKEAYGAIQWNLLFLIFSMLGMGIAMEKTGAAAWVATSVLALVDAVVSPELRPLVMLACVYLVTTILTEILSNNAAAAVMATLALGVAHSMGVDPRSFLMAVAVAASASFATPIGYQTNTYVYGVGGYRFADFVKIGVPLNLIAFVVTLAIAPRVWPF